MLVSNTSTLVLLAKARCLEQFVSSSPVIIIPEEVKKEALFEEDSYYARLISKLIEKKKLTMQKAPKAAVQETMANFRLDTGEAAAYTIFDEKKHKAILTDDGELIKLCKLEEVPFICAMAAVIRLYEKKKLTKDETLNKLKELNAIGRYSNEIYEYFKAEVK
jgi:predicted nucleic acid-binding protein